jgi:hypothetical protein
MSREITDWLMRSVLPKPRAFPTYFERERERNRSTICKVERGGGKRM